MSFTDNDIMSKVRQMNEDEYNGFILGVMMSAHVAESDGTDEGKRISDAIVNCLVFKSAVNRIFGNN